MVQGIRPAAGFGSLRRLVALSYGLLCHMLFAAAVAAMLFSMLFGLSRSLGPFSPPWSFIADAFLLLQFPLGHSFLLTRSGRAALRRLAPGEFADQLITTTYVIIASVQVILLFAFWSPSCIVWWRATGTLRAVSVTLYAGAWVLLAKSIIDAGVALQTGYLGWRAVLRNARPTYPTMPRRGLFRFCRQPIYAAFALTLWTVPVWTPDQLVLAFCLTAYCVLGPILKERRFRRLFGAEFEAFAREVPYFLPWPRPRAPRS